MSVACRQIYQPSLAEKVDPAPNRKDISLYIVTRCLYIYSQFHKIRNADFHVKVSRIAKQDPVLHVHKVFFTNDFRVAGDSDEDIPDL